MAGWTTVEYKQRGISRKNSSLIALSNDSPFAQSHESQESIIYQAGDEPESLSVLF